MVLWLVQAPEETPEQEAPRRTRRQKQATSADDEQHQQQTAVRSTRSRARQQQVQQQTDSQAAVIDDPHQQLQQQLSHEQQDEQQDALDDFQLDNELAASVSLVQGLLQQAEDKPATLLRPNPGMVDATRRATKVGVLAMTSAAVAVPATAAAAI